MPDVFISYSRADQPFVRRLHDALDTHGLQAWVDWEDIPPTAEWMLEVQAAIEGSDAFIFVISPDSMQSPVCARELSHAIELGKRLVPIVYRPVAPEVVPEEIGSRNWIFFREDDDFDAAVASLNTALTLDLDWAHEHTRLLVRAIEWDKNGRDRSFVLRGRDLQEADRQLSEGAQRKTPAPTPLQTEYLGASHHAATRSTRLKIIALSTALSVASALGVIALVQRATARHQATVARARSLVSASIATLQTDPELSLLLARNAFDQSAGPDAELVLREALDDSYVRETIPGVGPAISASYSSDGSQIIVAYQQGTAEVFNLRQPTKAIAVLKRDKTETTSAALSPDGIHAVIGSDDGVASVWNVENPSQALLLLTGHTGAISTAVFSPDGSRVVTSAVDGTARIWDAKTGNPLLTLTGHTGAVNDARFSPDGSRVVTAGSDGTARIWDAHAGGAALTTLDVDGARGAVFTANYSPDGTEIVTASSSNTGSPAPARVWAAATGQLLFAFPGEPGNVNDAVFSPDGTEIVTAGPDGTVRIWDASQSAPSRLTFSGHKGPVSTAVFSGDGGHVLSAGQDGSARIWTTRPNGERVVLHIAGPDRTIFDAVISPDGRRVATASNDGLARIWNRQVPGEAPVVLRGHVGPVIGVAFSPDGTRVATAGADGTARIWNSSGTGTPLILTGDTDAINAVEFSPDGRRIATASADGTARIWDASSGAQLFSLPVGLGGGAPQALYDLGFSPDGQRLAVVGQRGTAEVWSATRQSNFALLNFQTSDENGSVNSVVFSPNGKRVITTSDNGTAEVWDSRHGKRSLFTLIGHAGYVNDAEFSPNGKRIVTAGEDGNTRVWDATTGSPISTLRGQPGTILIATFTPDGRNILTASNNGTVEQWTCNLCVSTPQLLRLAAQRSTRSLTPNEMRAYLESG